MDILNVMDRIVRHPLRRGQGLVLWLTGVVLLASIACNSAIAAEDLCARAESTVEINKCVNERLKRAEDAMNSTYDEVLAQFDQPDGLGRPQRQQKENMEEAQRHWLKFRQANCFVVWVMNADGTIRTSLKLKCLEELTLQREQQLRKWFLPDTEKTEPSIK